MECILKFDLPKDEQRFLEAVNGGKAVAVVLDMLQAFRELHKPVEIPPQFTTPGNRKRQVQDDISTPQEAVRFLESWFADSLKNRCLNPEDLQLGYGSSLTSGFTAKASSADLPQTRTGFSQPNPDSPF